MVLNETIGFYPSNFPLTEFCKRYKFLPHKVVKILTNFIQKDKEFFGKAKIRLNSTILKNQLGNDYNKIIAALIDFEALLHTDGFVVGEKSNQYKLAPIYYESEDILSHSIVIPINPGLRKSLDAKYLNEYLKEQSQYKLNRIKRLPPSMVSERYGLVINSILDPRLKFDVNLALKILGNIPLDLTKEKDRDKFKAYKSTILSIRENGMFFKVDINGRFYSNLCSISKIFRCCFTFNEERLVEIDVSNTHPLLLANLCDEHFLIKLVKKDKAVEVDEGLFDEYISLLRTNPKDLDSYKLLVQSGKFYDSFEMYSPDYNREFVKANMMVVINDDGGHASKDVIALRIAFSDLYPTIYKLLDLLKSINHVYVSSVLMTMEAQLLIFMVPAEFQYKYPNADVPFLTIHDCYLIPESKQDLFIGFLLNFFRVSMGYELPIKIKPILPPSLPT